MSNPGYKLNVICAVERSKTSGGAVTLYETPDFPHKDVLRCHKHGVWQQYKGSRTDARFCVSHPYFFCPDCEKLRQEAQQKKAQQEADT